MCLKMKPFDFNNDKYHLGHFLLDSLKSNSDALCQIDAATGESETNASVLRRSVQLARCLRRFGTQPGDVLSLSGRNHLDAYIPFHAAPMIGMPTSLLDPNFKYSEIKSHFKITLPKIAFCEKEHVENYVKVIKDLDLDTKLICFGDGEYSMKSFIEQYNDINDKEEFTPLDFDVEKVYAWLISTSGTMSVVKVAAFTHKTVIINVLDALRTYLKEVASPNKDGKPILHLSPMYWLTSYLNTARAPYIGRPKLMTSAPVTTDHVIDIINKYKPIFAMMGPPFAKSLLTAERECDLSCLKLLALAGSKAEKETLINFQKILHPDGIVCVCYGQTENLGVILLPNPDGPVNNCGRNAMDHQKVKLVDPVTGREVTEPNVPGELWTVPCFSEYYNDPVTTANSITEDGWYKTGDLLYVDNDGNYFFLERLKMLIICRNEHIIPAELEHVIREHPGVQSVVVTSIPHEKDGEHPVACVVRKQGARVTAQEIRDMVAAELSDALQLRGGVVFMDEIPFTFTGKVVYSKLREIVLAAHRE